MKGSKTIKQFFSAGMKALHPSFNNKLIQKAWDNFRATHEGEITTRDVEKKLGSLKNNLVILGHDDYLRAFHAQWPLCSNLAKSSLGSTRMRDDVEILINGITGTLGEMALQKFLSINYGIEIVLDYSLDHRTAYYVEKDVAKLKVAGIEIDPASRVSVKSTKMNGHWLDIHGKQKEHSDLFVFVQVGIQSNTFLSFLNNNLGLGLRANLLRLGLDDSELLSKKADISIPVILGGIAPSRSEDQKDTIVIPRYTRDGKLRVNEIVSFHGDLKRKAGTESYEIEGGGVESPFEFRGIKTFTGINHYLVSSDRLKNSREDWGSLVEAIKPDVMKNTKIDPLQGSTTGKANA